MRNLKKYLAVLVLLSIFPMIRFVAQNLVLRDGEEVYNYIPQESDIIIEINCQNFVKEIAQQRIYHEDYMNENFPVEDYSETGIGIDYFSKIVLFREPWASENIWMALIKYSDRKDFEKFVAEGSDNPHVVYGDEYALLQISKSQKQEELDVHLDNIINKKVKPFSSRVNLKDYFDPEKEINMYFIPGTANTDNLLIDGYMGCDFKADHIEISGDFTPVTGFSDHAPIAYALNNDAPFSVRSSLSLINSIYWFSKERLDGIPDYNQMALDYYGMNLFMVDQKYWNYPFPFKFFPNMQSHFDVKDQNELKAFYDNLKANEKFKIDTTTNVIITPQGAFFKYRINGKSLDLMKSTAQFEPATDKDSKTYFDFQMQLAPLIDGIKFAIDEENPPPNKLTQVGLMAAQSQVADFHVLDGVEQIFFTLLLVDDSKLEATGKVQMQNRDGHSVVESLYFAQQALQLVSSMLK